MQNSKLKIQYKGSNGQILTRCLVAKWTFQDKAMGGQHISFSIESEKLIDFQVGDFCVYRGAYFYLNNLPSIIQNGRINESGKSFKYENVKFESELGDLSRVIILDITPTTGKYVAALETNYTGSSQFQLFCGETTAIIDGKHKVYTPVCTLAGKIQANLDRVFPNGGWKINVNTTTTHEENGIQVYDTHTEDKILSFNNMTALQALNEINKTFKLDYFVRGKEIFIGYHIGAITDKKPNIHDDNNSSDFYYLGYGKGYASKDNQGKSLFEIKKTADNSQQIVTRLRALGSKRNMPYRYYNKKYKLSQSLFPQNLQLPTTFETPQKKEEYNIERKKIYPKLRKVMGDTNDAYLDKNDNCFTTKEGLREGVGLWDGTTEGLEEIYPTIKKATYGELRGAGCADMFNKTETSIGQQDRNGHKSFHNYENLERIDEILAIGYLDKKTNKIIDDANIGDGILAEGDLNTNTYVLRPCYHNERKMTVVAGSNSGLVGSLNRKGEEIALFETIKEQTAGKYVLSPTFGRVGLMAKCTQNRSSYSNSAVKYGYNIKIYATSVKTKQRTLIGEYTSDLVPLRDDDLYKELEFAAFPDVNPHSHESQIKDITLTETSDVDVVWGIVFNSSETINGLFEVAYYVDNPPSVPDTEVKFKSVYVWDFAPKSQRMKDSPFHIIVKDMGIDFVKQFNSADTPKIVMSDGYCVAREFEIRNNIEKVAIRKDGKVYNGYQLELSRTSDDNIKVHFPSVNNRLKAGDHYVLIGIDMPDVYIKAAELRLLVAATKYLEDVSKTKYSYEPEIDELFLARNYDFCEAAGDVTKSIYWNLYAGLKFPFWSIPDSNDPNEELPIVNITIDSITIKEGEGALPKVELTLNEKIEQGAIQKITSTIEKIHNDSIFSTSTFKGVDNDEVTTLIAKFGYTNFLSKLSPDTAAGLITFAKGIAFNEPYGISEEAEAKLKSIVNEAFQQGIQGSGFGMWTDEEGRSHVEADVFTARMKAVFAQLEIRELSYVGGNFIFSPAGSKVANVVPLDNQGRPMLTEVKQPILVGGNFLNIGGKIYSLKHSVQGNAHAYRLYITADDGTTQTMNKWQVGDIVKCQTFNIANQKRAGHNIVENASNRYYARLCVGKGTEEVNGRMVDYIDLANTPQSTINGRNYKGYDPTAHDTPLAGDSIVQMGSMTNTDRQALIAIHAEGEEAPAIIGYERVNDYTLARFEVFRISPEKTRFAADRLELTTDRGNKTITDYTNETATTAATNVVNQSITRIEQTAERINLEVLTKTFGGTNLLRNTGFLLPMEAERGKLSYTDHPELLRHPDRRTAILSNTQGESSIMFAADVVPNTQYTLSAWLKGVASLSIGSFNDRPMQARLDVQAYKGSDRIKRMQLNGADLPTMNQWVYMHTTFTTPEECDRVEVRIVIINKGQLYISEPQLERGAKPTNWSPNTSDLEQALKRTGIDIAQGQITLQADRVAIKNQRGEQTAAFDDKGNLRAASLHTQTDEGVYTHIKAGQFEIGYQSEGTENRKAFDIGFDAAGEIVLRYYDLSGNLVGLIDASFFNTSAVGDSWSATPPLCRIEEIGAEFHWHDLEAMEKDWNNYYQFECGYSKRPDGRRTYNHTHRPDPPTFNRLYFRTTLDQDTPESEFLDTDNYIADGIYFDPYTTMAMQRPDHPTAAQRQRKIYEFEQGRMVRQYIFNDLDEMIQS